jgi:hypothetical protein
MSATSEESPIPRWKERLLALLVSFVLMILGGEIFCRWQIHQANAHNLEAVLAGRTRPVEGTSQELTPASFGDVIRMGTDPKVVYELHPNLQGVKFKGHELRTNHLGFRSASQIPKEVNTITILGLGDSIQFGHGVGQDDCYLEQLRFLLLAAYPRHDWRVINTAVPGYNTVMEVATLEAKGLPLEPDLILLGVCGNDERLPVYVNLAQDPYDLGHSFLWQKLRGQQPDSEPGLVHTNTQRAEGQGSTFDLPGRYDQLQGWKPLVGALERLKEISAGNQIPVFAMASITYSDHGHEANHASQILAACEDLGFSVLDMQPYLDQALLAETGKPFREGVYKHSSLVVSRFNLHPSVSQHKLIAQKCFEHLEESGALKRLMGP